MKWHIQSAGKIYDRGDEAVVYYESASGNTHLISEFAAHLINKIFANPSSTEQIIEGLSSEIDPENSSEVLTAVPKILSQLAELDIICQY